jgi:glycosyltransferase involved in cell wall biosynthesis
MSGGVERIITWLANRLSTDKIEVALISWDEVHGKPFYPVDEKVKIYNIGIGNPFVKATKGQQFKRIFRLRSIVKEFRPDIVVGFQIGTLVPLWLATFFLKIKIICTERNSLQFLTRLNYRHSKFTPHLYALADITVVQFEEYKSYFPKTVSLEVVNNPVTRMNFSDIDQRENLILSVGRLSFQKNYELLIEAFDIVHKKYPDWKLIILGSGEDSDLLKGLIKHYGLTAVVTLEKPVSNGEDKPLR